MKAKYYDESGNLLWTEEPYIFRNKWSNGQDFIKDYLEYIVLENMVLGDRYFVKVKLVKGDKKTEKNDWLKNQVKKTYDGDMGIFEDFEGMDSGMDTKRICNCGHEMYEHRAKDNACMVDRCECDGYNETDDEEVQILLNKVKLVETMSTLRLLALCYTERTKLVPIQAGTRNFGVIIEDKRLNDGFKKLYIPVTEFFGMHVAYCVEIDTLAYWK